ncbi:2-amino-4-hydroxy-6-hydroxymethyldihydropteridine diphosphokinase [Nautilia sp. PV-1]|uniref:2-amino-4-hydroxy-6- hydroxymethyldihydropteridine diphosphokinase n=1 Tax=Nautilia sp. PV-1 TaxID=2579250 RepID=UPI000FD7A8E7|nr:2-amino-4-hydroxy-6-hydroxymethyldihydropteridine diphosphokinase [Nautilia sp. PV-1]AZV47044.1 2-amino-4-hydroxy-6-hydroxymethyldihydropteridine diphosphokinase [Nautilia sp. PV-1]
MECGKLATEKNRNNKNIKIIKTVFFPAKIKKSRKKNAALIGIGCNLGNCIRRFKKLYIFLRQHPKIDIVQTSIIYKNPPFGYLNQPDFYNSVMVIKTDFSPCELLRFLLYTEKKFGRKRSFKNAPRTLDLDIILYNNVKINKKRLILPHPYYKKRDSVLVPLALKD